VRRSFAGTAPSLFHNGQAAYVASYVFLLLLIAYDLWSTHKLHRTTLWGSTFLVLMEQSTRIVEPSAPWYTFDALGADLVHLNGALLVCDSTGERGSLQSGNRN